MCFNFYKKKLTCFFNNNMHFNKKFYLVIPSWKQNVILKRYITKNVKFWSFWKTLITLKIINIFQNFWSRFKDLHSSLLFKIFLEEFSWILFWGQTRYKNVTFKIKILLYTLYELIQNINIFIHIPKFYYNMIYIEL